MRTIRVKLLAVADPTRMILLAPVIFVAHVCEEAPGFVNWFNSLVRQGISQPLFLSVNGVAFLVTLALTAVAAWDRNLGSMLAALAWLGFLMLANGIFHLTGTLVHARYSPGTITAASLYLPYFGWLVWLVHRRFGISILKVVAVSSLAGIPMFVHGYLIVFEGRRLF